MTNCKNCGSAICDSCGGCTMNYNCGSRCVCQPKQKAIWGEEPSHFNQTLVDLGLIQDDASVVRNYIATRL